MRILELSLYGVEIEVLRRFYAGILGLRELDAADFGQFSLRAGRTRLNFRPAPHALAGSPPRYHFAFDVPVPRFQAALRWLDQRGGPIASPEGETTFHGSWNADSVYFRDPQGSILELIARHTLPPEEHAVSTPPERLFDAAEIMAVTEIGLATSSVADTVGALCEHLPGLKVYDGEGSDTFTAVGDPHGLIIVVRRGRIWFPETGVPAQDVPLEALVELETGRRYRVSAPPFPFTTLPTA